MNPSNRPLSKCPRCGEEPIWALPRVYGDVGPEDNILYMCRRDCFKGPWAVDDDAARLAWNTAVALDLVARDLGATSGGDAR